MKGRIPDFAGVQSYLKFYYNNKKYACDFSQQLKFLSKWKLMKNLFVLNMYHDVMYVM